MNAISKITDTPREMGRAAYDTDGKNPFDQYTDHANHSAWYKGYGDASWRDYVANVRADAIEPGSAEVAQFMADNPGEFADEAEAIEAYRADHAFLCPILGHFFRFEDGVEIDGVWVHMDADLIGSDDINFDYEQHGRVA